MGSHCTKVESSTVNKPLKISPIVATENALLLKLINSSSNEFHVLLSKFALTFRHLYRLKEPGKIVEDPIACEILKSYDQSCTDIQVATECMLRIDPMNKFLIHEIFANLLYYCFDDCTQYIKINRSDPQGAQVYKFKYEIVRGLVNFCWLLSGISIEFVYKFHEKHGTNILIKYLAEPDLVAELLNHRKMYTDKLGRFFLKSVLHVLHNESKIGDVTKRDWEKMEATEKLQRLHDQAEPDHNDLCIMIFLITTNIMNEEEIENLTYKETILPDIVRQHLNSTVEAIATNSSELKRIKVQIDCERTIEVALVIVNGYYEYNIADLWTAIYKMTVNDKLKYRAFERLNLGPILKSVIIHGNVYEKEYATKLLWQLSFDETVVNEMCKDLELLDQLNRVLKNSRKDSKLHANIKGIMFQMELKLNKRSPASRVEPNSARGVNSSVNSIDPISETTSNEHIMISYNKEHRDICLKIKKELENSGHKVWIDVEDISGSSLESMANAIENAKCVLICMTEYYKQSVNCRAEAEYSFNLKKPIVPLILQKNYVPDGWLGIILGSKIYVNFAKYSFEECVKKLKFEIEKSINDSNVTKGGVTSSHQGIMKEHASTARVGKWSNEDVRNWLREKRIVPEIEKNLRNFDGELLVQLHNIYKSSPSFFFSHLDSKGTVDLYQMTRFLNELEKLVYI